MKTANRILTIALFVVALVSVGTTAFAQCERGERGERFRENVDVAHALTDDGVILTMTSDDEEVVARLHERLADGDLPMLHHADEERFADVEFATNELDNGVEIIVSSDDPDVVERIQERAENGGRGHGGERGGRGDRFRESVDLTVTTLDNGAVITMTTDDADALEHMMEHSDRLPPFLNGRRGHDEAPEWLESVQFDVEELSNGLEVTVTSDDAEIAERIIERAERAQERHAE